MNICMGVGSHIVSNCHTFKVNPIIKVLCTSSLSAGKRGQQCGPWILGVRMVKMVRMRRRIIPLILT